jgi:hypothetical protein
MTCFATRQNLKHFRTKMHPLTTTSRIPDLRLPLYTAHALIHLTLVASPTMANIREAREQERRRTHAVEVE